MTPRAALSAGRFPNATPINRTRALFLTGMVLLAICVLPAPVWAQQPVTLASLQISIWPEFDRPSCLVILDGTVAPGVPLPAQLTVRMPSAATAPNAVAVTGADGSLLQAAYTTATDGGDIIIKFTTSLAGFRVEYYDPGLVISGDSRSYAFRWKSDFAVAAVAVRVQEPYGANNLTGIPALSSAGAGEYGLNYDTASLGPLAAGGTVSLDVNYAKSGATLSATAVGPAASGGGQGSGAAQGGAPIAAAASGTTANLPWILGSAALGLALVVGGLTWYLRSNRPATSSGTARQRRRSRAEPARAAQNAAWTAAKQAALSTPAEAATKEVAAATLGTGPVRFCTQCGQRHQLEDLFCRQCGAPVRE